MFALAMITLAVALAASGWTTAYAWTAALPDLMWLDRARRWEAWLESIQLLHLQVYGTLAFDTEEPLEVAA